MFLMRPSFTEKWLKKEIIPTFGACVAAEGQPGVVGQADRDVQPVLSALILVYPW